MTDDESDEGNLSTSPAQKGALWELGQTQNGGGESGGAWTAVVVQGAQVARPIDFPPPHRACAEAISSWRRRKALVSGAGYEALNVIDDDDDEDLDAAAAAAWRPCCEFPDPSHKASCFALQRTALRSF